MSFFDKVIFKYSGFPGYKGNPPTTEQEYNSVDWRNDWEKPTWETVQAEIAKVAYQYNRASEYPPITDYLDGVVKGDQSQINKYISDCLAVKAKYPKGNA
jgi:hypothetical protein